MNNEKRPLANNEEILRGGAYFESVRIDRLDLQKATLKEVEFRGCRFDSVRFVEGALANCMFDECEFYNSDLTMVRLDGTGLFGIRFTRSKLMGVNWTQARGVPDLYFEQCTLDHSSFMGMPMSKAVFDSCRMLEVNFVETDLRQARFSNCDLNGSRFLRTNLGKANLSTATRYVIDPVNNTVRNAIFSLEGAVNLTEFFGIKVDGFGRSEEES